MGIPGRPTQDEIGAAYLDMVHGCDGPVDPFVLIGRAIDLAERHAHGHDALTNGLYDALLEWGVDFNDAITAFHGS